MGGVNKPTNKPADNNANSLSTVHVPVSDVDCHSCTAPCDQIGDFEDLPKNFDGLWSAIGERIGLITCFSRSHV